LHPSQKKRECHVQCSQSASATTSTRRRWPTSRIGDFNWERRYWPQPVIRWRRSPLKLVMSPKPPSTVHSNASSQFRPRVSAVNRDGLMRLGLTWGPSDASSLRSCGNESGPRPGESQRSENPMHPVSQEGRYSSSAGTCARGRARIQWPSADQPWVAGCPLDSR